MVANKNDLIRLKDKDGIYRCPVAKSDGVFMPDGNTTLTKKIQGLDEQLETIAFNVLSLGAKGDGVTDDTSVIQNILNNNIGKPVFFQTQLF